MTKEKRSTEDMIEEDFAGSQETALSKRNQDNGWAMQPANLSEAMKLCKFLAESKIVPDAYRGRASDIFVAIQHGQEVGLQPLQSLNSVAVINGQPSLWGSAPLALARQHPEFEWIREDNEAFAYARDHIEGWQFLEQEDPDLVSVCIVKRKGEPPAVRTFSDEDRKRAGLGNVHKSYPKIMRRYRARSQALEAAFGDALMGFKQAEVEKENAIHYGLDEEGTIGVDFEDAEVVEDEPKTPKVSQSIKKSMAAKTKKGKPANSAPKASKSEEVDDDTSEAEQESPEAEEEPQEPIEDLKELTPDDRESMMATITKKSKDQHKGEQGMAWHKAIKEEIKDIKDDASTMMDLNDEELMELFDRFT